MYSYPEYFLITLWLWRRLPAKRKKNMTIRNKVMIIKSEGKVDTELGALQVDSVNKIERD